MKDKGLTSQPMTALIILSYFGGFLLMINGAASPYIAKEFGLDDAGIARVFGCLAIGGIGAFMISRIVDKIGRRKMILILYAACS